MRTPQELENMARATGLSKGTVEKHLKTILAPEILTNKINQKLASSFDDPLTNRHDNPVLPPWKQAFEKAILTKDTDDIQSALQMIRKREIEIESTHPKFSDAMKVIGDEGAAIEQLMAWAKSKPDRLEKAAESGWHKLAEFLQSDHDHVDDKTRRELAGEPQIFLVQHNWAAAFAGAEDFAEGEFRLPYAFCAFEFRISGRRVIVPCRQQDTSIMAVICVQYGNWWTITEQGDMNAAAEGLLKDELWELNRLLRDNVKAICVALEAEVATTEIIRAPHRLNSQRERSGRLPLSDYRVINLARRARPNPLPEEYHGEPGQHARKRLHFRRGHWRHYATFKTWVRWCLVGDPDLGFIDHDYRA